MSRLQSIVVALVSIFFCAAAVESTIPVGYSCDMWVWEVEGELFAECVGPCFGETECRFGSSTGGVVCTCIKPGEAVGPHPPHCVATFNGEDSIWCQSPVCVSPAGATCVENEIPPYQAVRACDCISPIGQR